MENNENLEDRIVDVAKDVFLENGFEMTSMSDIAAKVGINRPTLHYYFRTKERMTPSHILSTTSVCSVFVK